MSPHFFPHRAGSISAIGGRTTRKRRKSGNEMMIQMTTWVPSALSNLLKNHLSSSSESHSGKAHKPTPPPTQHHPQPFIPKAAKPTGSFANLPQKVHFIFLPVPVGLLHPIKGTLWSRFCPPPNSSTSPTQTASAATSNTGS